MTAIQNTKTSHRVAYKDLISTHHAAVELNKIINNFFAKFLFEEGSQHVIGFGILLHGTTKKPICCLPKQSVAFQNFLSNHLTFVEQMLNEMLKPK